MSINRREAWGAITASGALPLLGGSAEAPPKNAAPANAVFAHGVASGDPLGDCVIIWTRISGASGATRVAWEVSQRADFSRLVASGTFMTDAGRDYTVKVDVAGLKPGTDYVYRFRALKAISAVGKTRTLPEKTDRLVLAVASCSLHPNGYFNAYQAIADLAEVDCVFHLGDYIYEYGASVDDYGMTNGLKLNRLPEPPHEIISLADYRMRHAQYKRDLSLQAAHARAPWICVFDDHELCNNPWKGGAENHNPDKGEGDFFVRKAAALKAYGEWMPIRDPAPGQLREAIYRSFRFGDLAEFIMLETRLLARTEQLDYAHDLTFKAASDGKPAVDTEAFLAKLNDPARELLGPTERDWLKNTMSASVKDGVRWQVLGNQIVMARTYGPDLLKLMGPQKVALALETLPAGYKNSVKAMVGLFSGPTPMPFNLDAWDGYPAERERVFDMIKAAGARTLVLSGDSHCAWANALNDASGGYVAAEIGVTSITSPTNEIEKYLPGVSIAALLQQANPASVKAADDHHNGFVRLTLTADVARAEWMMVDTITDARFTASTRKTFAIKATASGVGPIEVI
jgi:alkaline phosphatase D